MQTQTIKTEQPSQQPSQLTEQEIFNACVSHILNQKEPALSSDGNCKYKTDDGLSCVVGGPIVKAGLYNPEIEDVSISVLRFDIEENKNKGLGPKFGLEPKQKILLNVLTHWGVKQNQLLLLAKLQHAHDNCAKGSALYEKPFLSEFILRTKKLAEEFNLTYPE